MRRTETFYAVEITPAHRPHEPRLAIGSPAGPELFYWRRQAVQFKRDLVPHVIGKLRVVRVATTFEWEP